MSKFLTKLESRYLGNGYLELITPLIYYSSYLDGILVAPEGFISDGESIPRIPFIYSWLAGTSLLGGVMHDDGYRIPDPYKATYTLSDYKNYVSPEDLIEYGEKFIVGFLDKQDADLIYLEIMILRGNSKAKRKAKYKAVDLCGAGSYYKLSEYASLEEVLKAHGKNK